jgi:hypothetical protein
VPVPFVTRRTEAEKHDCASRIASPGLHPNDRALRGYTLVEQLAIRLFPARYAGFHVLGRFILRE